MQVFVEILRGGLGIPPNFNGLEVPKFHTAQDIVDGVKHCSLYQAFSFGRAVP